MFDKRKIDQITRLAKRRHMYAKAIEGIDVEAAIKDFNERQKHEETHESVNRDAITEKQNTK